MQFKNIIMENEEWRISAGKQSEKVAESFSKVNFAETMESIYESMVI